MSIFVYSSIPSSSQSVDRFGRFEFHASFGEKWVASRLDDISLQFRYNISTEDCIPPTLVGTGGVASVDAKASLTSGLTLNSSARLQSRHWVRYRSGHDGFAFFTAAWITPPTHANGYSRLGVFDSEDGFYIGYSGTSWGVVLRYASTDEFIAQANFNIDKLDGQGPSGFVLNKGFLNIFCIQWGWLGIAPIYFGVYGGPAIGMIPFHIINKGNSQVLTSIKHPIIPFGMEVGNGGTAVNVRLDSGSWNAGMLGDGVTRDVLSRYHSAYNVKGTITTILSVIGLQNPTTFLGQTNKIAWKLSSIGVRIDGGSEIILKIHRNPTVTGASYVTAVDAVNSTALKDTAGGAVTAEGTVEFIAGVPGNSGDHYDLTNENIFIYPGETVHISAETGGGVIQAAIGIRWQEFF